MEEFIEQLREVSKSFQRLKDEKAKLCKEQSVIDSIQEDLLHELEFSKLSAVEMMKLTKQLINTRKSRREIKIAHEIFNCVIDSYSAGIQADTILERIEKVKYNNSSKKYSPRVLKDLKIGRRG